MTNGTSGYLPPDKKRSVIENSILAFRPEDARKYQWDPPEARQALADLAAGGFGLFGAAGRTESAPATGRRCG